MADQTSELYLWGFPAATRLPHWLAPHLVEAGDLPVQGTILVYETQAEDFITAMKAVEGADLREQHAILYVTGTGAELPDAWLYFAEVVEPDDWPALRSLISCPHQAESAQLALAVPADQIPSALERLIAAPFESGALAGLPLLANASAALIEHISTCEACRRELAVALTAQQQWATQFYCPSVVALAAYARGETHDSAIATHVATCPDCAAEIAVLKQLEPALTWLSFDLGAELVGRLSGAREVIRAFFETLFQPPLSLESAGPAARLMGPAGNDTPDQTYESAGSDLLISDDHEFSAAWDVAAEQIRVEDIRDSKGNPYPWFRVVISSNEQQIWQDESTPVIVNERNVQQVVIPTTIFTSAVAGVGINLRIEVRPAGESDGGAA